MEQKTGRDWVVKIRTLGDTWAVPPPTSTVSPENVLGAEEEKTFLLENALDAVVGVDEHNIVIFWNKNAEAIFGWSKEEIFGQDFTEKIIPLGLREPHRAGMQRFISTGVATIQNRRIEIPGLRKNGEVFPMELTVSSIRSGSGYRFYSFMRDVTEQKNAKDLLRQSEEELRTLANWLPQLTWMAHANGHIFWYNERWYEYTGTAPKDMEGWGWQSVHDPAILPAVMDRWTLSVETGKPFEMTFPLRGKDGRYRAFLTRVNPIRDSNGNLVRWFGTNTDVEDTIRAQKDADAAKVEAERANQLKSAFLANMSHEIRTPLGAMIGFADLLRDPNLSAQSRSDYLDVLTRNGEQLSYIINDILDLSKVEAGHLTLEYLPMHVQGVASDVISLLAVKARERELALEYRADGTADEEVVSDPLRVRQVLINLVSNAIKFTHHGSVKMRSFNFEKNDGRKMSAVEIIDTGIGIPAGQTDHIFETFVQGDGSMTRRFGGTGLGLALSRSLARQLGGDITVTATAENVGSTFLFTFEDRPERRDSLQAEAPSASDEPMDLSEGSKPLAGLNVLVVDDSADNRQLISHFLNRVGAVTESAKDGAEAFNKGLRGTHDLILMDIQMPVMDGYTATNRLRSEGYRKPIIALTAHAMAEVRKKCLNAGCSDHLSKPINAKELVEKIARYTLKARTQEKAGADGRRF